jgi:hypothetical protein
LKATPSEGVKNMFLVQRTPRARDFLQAERAPAKNLRWNRAIYPNLRDRLVHVRAFKIFNCWTCLIGLFVCFCYF